jgi:hypothetical protein
VESLFGRVSRYPRSPALDPVENRLTEVTAAVFERVDDAARQAVIALLATAIEQAGRKATTEPHNGQWMAEAKRVRTAMHAAGALGPEARTRIRTQLATPKGRFVDMEVWLRPGRPASTLEDIVIWVEAKYGADVHGDQLDVYLADIEAHPARHRIVLLLLPRGQTLKTKPPPAVHVVDWQTISHVVNDVRFRAGRPKGQRWLVDEYSDYLEEEGLMDPDALSAAHAVALMQAGDAADAIAGICEHGDAIVQKEWAKANDYGRPPRSASKDPAFGLGYWASFDAQPNTSNWREGWFEWGNDDPENWQYVDDDNIRGSNAFYAALDSKRGRTPTQSRRTSPWWPRC